MLDEIQIFAKLVDYPVTVFAFVWALRMIRTMYCDMQELLERCLDTKFEEG